MEEESEIVAEAPYTSSKKIKRAMSANTTAKKKKSVNTRQGTISIDNVGHGQAAASPKSRKPV